MSIRLYRYIMVALVPLGVLGVVGCTDVAVDPQSEATADKVLAEEEPYVQFLAKLYAGLNTTGQSGPAGDGDIGLIDEGFSQYLRLHWKMQELPADAATIAWEDFGVQQLNNFSWNSGNQFPRGMYYRIFYQVSQVSEFLNQTTDKKIEERDINDEMRERIPQFRAEARFLRALSYWHGLDIFRNIPLYDEEEFELGGEPPEQASPREVFKFIESELLAITGEQGDTDEVLAEPGEAPYGRADKAAAWMLLAKLYQNAPVYIDESYEDRVVEFTRKIIDYSAAQGGGVYALESDYRDLFRADNDRSDEFIFAIPHDGENTQHYGGTTFLTHAACGAGMDSDNYGVNSCWAGLRTVNSHVRKYDNADIRDDFFVGIGQSDTIGALNQYSTGGTAAPKYTNVTSGGTDGPNGTFVDTDYPMFRLADAYLMYAEAVVRGGNGSQTLALDLVNDLRERAGLGRDITASDLTLDFILEERARELMWEGHRRTDLVRHGEFVSGEWTWKGGQVEGRTNIGDKFKIFPIPSSELSANPNLEQNPGY